MVDLYLIAHRCRGEPTFDVAERLDCPKCHPGYDVPATFTCDECDDVGYWWILSTCGYRAHPWWSIRLKDCTGPMKENSVRRIHISLVSDMPTDSLDCFPINSLSHKSLPDRSNNLLARLGLTPKLPPLRRL